MKNFKLVVEYDGTDFHGWQRQRGLRTVSGVLEDVLQRLVGTPIEVNGAGRTDAGVHALGQVCNFFCETRLTAEQVAGALNSLLPDDVRVRESCEVDADFHARFSAKSRRYTYYIRTHPTAVWRRFSHVVTYPLDVGAMQQAARTFIGEKDFSSFTPSRAAEFPTVCRVIEAQINRQNDCVVFSVEADHFLHHMVRVMMGTLVEVGRGKIPSERVGAIMGKRDRTAAGPTIPPNGLFLTEVKYGE